MRVTRTRGRRDSFVWIVLVDRRSAASVPASGYRESMDNVVLLALLIAIAIFVPVIALGAWTGGPSRVGRTPMDVTPDEKRRWAINLGLFAAVLAALSLFLVLV